MVPPGQQGTCMYPRQTRVQSSNMSPQESKARLFSMELHLEGRVKSSAVQGDL